MHKDDSFYIKHIYDTATKITQLIDGKTKSDYDADETLRLAITHLLQIIGEAANQVSSEYRNLHPDIPWHAIVGMRHRIVHAYWDIDEEIVWETAVHDIPELLSKIAPLIEED